MTIVLVFGYPTPATPAPIHWLVLWNIGVLMVLVGGYWFFFFIRVDVAKEGHSPFRLVRADLFIVSLLASVTFALIWELVQTAGNPTATMIALPTTNDAVAAPIVSQRCRRHQSSACR